MNVVFFGTSEFALPSLRELIASRHKVLAVVTQPDRKKGRNLQLMPPPTKVLAETHNIPVCQPEKASSADSVGYLKTLGADLFVVVSFGQILSKELLAIPKTFAINVHGSLLPKYRGAAPTNWAIINGDAASGVTIMKMNERLDEGDIISKEEIPIDKEDTNITLGEKLSELGAKALLGTLDDMAEDRPLRFTPQDHSAASYAPKLKKENGLIKWNEPAARIHDKVRGFLPWPGAYTRFDGKTLKILRTEITSEQLPGRASGEVVDIVKNKGMVVKTGDSALIVTHLQLEGKKVLDTDAFLRGHRIDIGYRFK
ncbi:MAG: methionyl-tRNA formyltransferase [Candidatus Omnitrophica bacterium]|nr:methionyl-tRNA formyltransferase [Candidatus Omnitrophota bacterium]